jgi:acetyl esterase
VSCLFVIQFFIEFPKINNIFNNSKFLVINLKKLPPAYVVTAGHDLLHDEGEIYSHKLRQNGVKVQYVDYPDQSHGFINITPVSSKAKRNTIEIAKNFRKFWDKHS